MSTCFATSWTVDVVTPVACYFSTRATPPAPSLLIYWLCSSRCSSKHMMTHTSMCVPHQKCMYCMYHMHCAYVRGSSMYVLSTSSKWSPSLKRSINDSDFWSLRQIVCQSFIVRCLRQNEGGKFVHRVGWRAPPLSHGVRAWHTRRSGCKLGRLSQPSSCLDAINSAGESTFRLGWKGFYCGMGYCAWDWWQSQSRSMPHPTFTYLPLFIAW